MNPIGRWLALVSCVLACHSGAKNTPKAGLEVSAPLPKEELPKGDPPKANPTYDAYDGPLVVSDDSGVFLLDPQGAIQATISNEPGLHPRWLRPGESLLVLRPGTEDATWTLLEIDIASGTERLITKISLGDTVECPPGSVNEYGEELEQQLREDLDVQDDTHFGVNAARGLACAWFMDRNFNMHSLAVEAKVQLVDGAVVSKPLRAYHCTPAPEEVADDPDCLSMQHTIESQRPSDAELASIGPYRVHDGALWRREGKTEELIAGPFSERIDPETENPSGLATFSPYNLSPSGRWAMLWGNESWGDYLHASWLLLDTQSGELFAVSGPTWPAPLATEALSRLDYATVDNDVTPESTLVWLSDDRLVVGRWLILPGKAVIELPGELAR